MKVLRPFVWAAAMVAAFLYITSMTRWDVGRILPAVRGTPVDASPRPPLSVGGFTPDEQNNIDVYRTPATPR